MKKFVIIRAKYRKPSFFIHRIPYLPTLKAVFAKAYHTQKAARIDLALAQKHARGDLHGQLLAVAVPKKLIGVARRVLAKLLGDELAFLVGADTHYQVLARNETQFLRAFGHKIQPAVRAQHYFALKFVAKALF